MPLPPFADDLALLDWVARSLYTGVVSDACDACGYRDRALGPDVRALGESMGLRWRAEHVLRAAKVHGPERPEDKEIAAVHSPPPGEAFVMAVGRSDRIVPWGELLSTATVARGGRGAVLD